MLSSELDFEYPAGLVATERVSKSRVMVVDGPRPRELARGLSELPKLFLPGDVLVINDTRVVKRRVFAESGLEILFLSPVSPESQTAPDFLTWSVLCPSTKWKDGEEEVLPGGVRLKLLARGRPQTVLASMPLTDEYFEKHGELPLPPYIQKARGERNNRASDAADYQSVWATQNGSLAAPTASLHFTKDFIETLRAREVHVVDVTLHVGLGTFLPLTAEKLDEHVMHSEYAEIPGESWRIVQEAKKKGHRVWAMGTTATRTLESAAHGLLSKSEGGGFIGDTSLFIKPGFEFKVVDVLMTNFHQPRSTLLALVASFKNLALVKTSYAWAIERNFRLFSYGDLSVWMR